jgi:pimeloyl-ACP methyl ester carboxylesterase
MKNLSLTLILFVLIPTILTGQTIKIEPYEFVSKANDTVQAELGTFCVLEDRTNGGNDSIQLAFIRFKSTNPQPGNPIVYLAGGPGGSGINTARGRRFELFMKLRGVADVIVFDQRGTGLSENLPDCPYSAEFELGRAIDKPEYIQKTTAMISRCLEFWKNKQINLQAYNTTESARDIDELRKVLNADKISLWGISYGSHLAFEYVRLFEDSIDKLVLASLEGPNETIKLPKDTEDFVFMVAKQAAENYGSEITYPHLKEKIIAVHERLKKNPIISSYPNRQGGRDMVGISNFELQSAIATFYLKNPSDIKKLPRIYQQMYQGNFSEIAPNVMVMKRYIYSRIRPMSFAMDMHSGISPQRVKQVNEQIDQAILGSSINFLLFEWMTNVDFSQLPEGFRELKPNKVDALLLSGRMDGRTYVNSGIEIAKKFENGHHMIIENAGHDLYMQSPFIGNLVVNFFSGKEPSMSQIELHSTKFE